MFDTFGVPNTFFSSSALIATGLKDMEIHDKPDTRHGTT